MKRKMIFAVLGAVFCVALAAQSPTAPFEGDGAASWKALGPTGGGTAALEVNPANPNEVYAVSSGYQGQVYRSTNGGASWTRQSVFNDQLFDVALTPGNPNVMYVLGYDEVFKSVDKGVSWTPYPLGNYNQGTSGRIFVSPANPDVLFVAGTRTYQTSPNWWTCMAIHRSTNGGATWTTTLLQPDTDYAYMGQITGNAAQPQTLYAAGYGHRSGGNTTYYIYKSTNNGGTWTKIAEPVNQANGLVVHPSDANRVWYCTYNGIYRSADGGSSWEPGTGYLSAYALALDRTNPQVLYAGSISGCYKSTDGGITWNNSAAPPPGTGKDIAAGGAAILYGASGGIYRSTDGGTTFKASQSGYKATDIMAIASAPSSPSTMYAESSGAAIFKSTNAGSSWKALPYFYRCEAVLKIIVESSSPSKVFILAGG
jgi:photosystem II stability/assembly factor-like uncharacterized protein